MDEFNALMLDAQGQTYGDGLDPDALHPYMWAAKGHYYSTRSFYNFPYMFGLLFGLGLYAAMRPTRRASAPATTRCSPRPAWPTRRRWRRASALMCANPTSGAPAWA